MLFQSHLQLPLLPLIIITTAATQNSARQHVEIDAKEKFGNISYIKNILEIVHLVSIYK